MARAKKKFSRKDMKKPDEFLQKSWEFSEWAGKHARQIIIITAGIIVAVLVGAFLWSYSESRQVKSSRQMDAVFEVASKPIAPTEYSPGKEPSGDNETYGSKFHQDEALLDAYTEARDKAKSKGVKKIATLGIARTLLGLEKYQEARKEFKSLADDPSGMGGLLHFVYEGLGFAYEGLGKKEEAMGQYKRLEKCDGGSYKELAMYHMARLYEAENKSQEAVKLYRQIANAINEAEEMSPLLAYLQEKISGKEGVDLGPAMFKSPGTGLGPGLGPGQGSQLTPEMLEEFKKKLDAMKKEKDDEAREAEKAEEEAGAEAEKKPEKKKEEKPLKEQKKGAKKIEKTPAEKEAAPEEKDEGGEGE